MGEMTLGDKSLALASPAKDLCQETPMVRCQGARTWEKLMPLGHCYFLKEGRSRLLGPERSGPGDLVQQDGQCLN